MMSKIGQLQNDMNRIKLDQEELEGNSRHLKQCLGVDKKDTVKFLEQ